MSLQHSIGTRGARMFALSLAGGLALLVGQAVSCTPAPQCVSRPGGACWSDADCWEGALESCGNSMICAEGACRTRSGSGGGSGAGGGLSDAGGAPRCDDGIGQAGEFCIDGGFGHSYVVSPGLGPWGWQAPCRHLLTGDLDGDGDPDAILFDRIYENVDAGSFVSRQLTPDGGVGVHPILYDLLDNSLPELFLIGTGQGLSYPGTPYIYFSENDGGTFGPLRPSRFEPYNKAASTGDAIVGGRFQPDGGWGLAYSAGVSSNATELHVARYNGDRFSVAPFQQFDVWFWSKDITSAMAAADLDGDGIDEVIAAHAGPGPGQGLVEAYKISSHRLMFSWPAASWATDLDPVDIDHDGDLDVLAANSTGILMRENVRGVYADRSLPTGSQTKPACLEVTDLNGDGRNDILSTHNLRDEIRAHFGRQDGGFRTVVLPMLEGAGPQEVRAVDVNGDGSKDLVIFGSGTVNFRSAAIYIWLSRP